MESLDTNLVPEEIIIKCSVEEMMKAFFKDYVIIWHDPCVENQENTRYIAQVRRFCEVFTFTEWERCSNFIRIVKAVCHVITSGTNGEVLVNEIYECKNVHNIYIFCGDKQHHSLWARYFAKVSCIETNIQNIMKQIEKNLLKWYKKASSLNLNLPAFAPIFDDNDKIEVHRLHLYLKKIPKFKNQEQAKDDFVRLSRMIYSDEKNSELLDEFEKDYNVYNKKKTLKWYTRESFLYKVTNNCLRIATDDSIQYFRLLLRDIERAIKDQYGTKSKSFSGLVYRAGYLSDREWSDLKENLDKEIEIHGFLSVSKEKNVALKLLQTDPSKNVFITIIVPKGPKKEEQGFAEVEEFSKYPDEKEILFNVRSRFTVLETEENYMYSEASKCHHLVLLYGAQGFRKFVAEKNPIQEIQIPSMESISCAHCKTKSERLFFVSIADREKQNHYYCGACINYGVAPFSCISNMDKVDNPPYTSKVFGCLLKMNSSQTRTPFYGYKCFSCKAKKQKSYFVCTDCHVKKWCENCFEETSTCLEAGHNIILETSPFSFWCEKMSVEELKHLEFQKALAQKGGDAFQQAEMYFESHKYEKAKEYYSRYIEENEAKSRDENLALSYNNLGLIYNNQGGCKKALQYLSESLDIRQCLYKRDDHPEVATSYNNIGLVFNNQGDYKKALEYHGKSLEIRKSVYEGDKHPEVATSLSNIGLVYNNQGDYKKALEYHEKSLDIRKSIYEGDNHLDIATSYHNIGLVFNNQGDYKKALEYHGKSLEIRKSVYGGDNHPEVATSYNNLGLVYNNQGDYKKALEYHKESLNIRKSVYGGGNHPEVATSYHNIGLVFDNQREYKEALRYYWKSLNIRKSVYGGDNHPEVATSYHNVGLAYESQGDDTKALQYYFKSLNIKKSIYGGENHPEIAAVCNNIGHAYFNKGENNKALDYYFKCLGIDKSLYGGDNHRLVAASYNNIGLVFDNQREYKEALRYYWKSLDIRKSVYGGDNHPKVATSYNNMGLVYEKQGEYKIALQFLRKSLDIRKSVYGFHHPSVLQTLNSILRIQSTH